MAGAGRLRARHDEAYSAGRSSSAASSLVSGRSRLCWPARSQRGELETTWFERHGSTPTTEIPSSWPREYREAVEQRIALIESDPDVGLIERPEHKRRWNRVAAGRTGERRANRAGARRTGGTEVWADLRPRSTAELTEPSAQSRELVEAARAPCRSEGRRPRGTLRRLVVDVPYRTLRPAPDREGTAQARGLGAGLGAAAGGGSRGRESATMPVPPRYAQRTFGRRSTGGTEGSSTCPRSASCSSRTPSVARTLRPSLDGPVGTSAISRAHRWASHGAPRTGGRRRRTALRPLLAGVLELLPWIHQWHPDRDRLRRPAGAVLRRLAGRAACRARDHS